LLLAILNKIRFQEMQVSRGTGILHQTQLNAADV
jgi:hypothetical protein